MKKITLLGLLFVAAILSAACGGASDNKATADKPSTVPPTKEELVALDRQAQDAWKSHDSKFFETFLSDNFIGFGNTRWTDKQSAINDVANHKCDIKTITMEEPVMKMVGPDVAVVTYKANYDGTCDGKKMPNTRAATVFVRKATFWLGAYHSETAIVTPPAGDKKAPAAKKEPSNTAKAPAAKSGNTNSAPASGEVDVKKDVNNETADKKAADEKKAADAGAANSTSSGATITSKDPALTEALLAVEKIGWEAWKDHDAKKLDEITTKDMMFVNPMGVFAPDKAATLKDWAGDPPCNVSSVSITDAQSSSVTAEVGILTYKGTAVGTCGDQKLTPLWGGTVFFNEGGNWKAAFMIEQPMS